MSTGNAAWRLGVEMGAEMDVEEVRSKLLAIIDANPDENGEAKTPGIEEGAGCVYFLDAQNRPINTSRLSNPPVLIPAAPCCIVGHFFWDMPEAMGDALFVEGLQKNLGIQFLRADKINPAHVTDDAVDLLSYAQEAQDTAVGFGQTWADIRDDIVGWFPGIEAN